MKVVLKKLEVTIRVGLLGRPASPQTKCGAGQGREYVGL